MYFTFHYCYTGVFAHRCKSSGELLYRLYYCYIASFQISNLHFIIVTLKPGLIGVLQVWGGEGVDFVSQFYSLGIITRSALYRLGRIPNLSEIDTARLTLPIFLTMSDRQGLYVSSWKNGYGNVNI